MAKKEVSEQKANLYLLAIVAIVAVVGIVVLVLNSGGVSVSTDDLTGQAINAKSSLKSSFKLWNLKDIKDITKIVYKLDDGTMGLGAIYPATTNEGKTLLSKTTAISMKDKKATLSVIKDKATGNLIGGINKLGKVNDFWGDNIDFASMAEVEPFTIGGSGYYWINDEYMDQFGDIASMTEMQSMMEMMAESAGVTGCTTICHILSDGRQVCIDWCG